MRGRMCRVGCGILLAVGFTAGSMRRPNGSCCLLFISNSHSALHDTPNAQATVDRYGNAAPVAQRLVEQ